MVEAKQGEKVLANSARANDKEGVGITAKKGTQQQSAKNIGNRIDMARVRRKAVRRGAAKEEGNKTSTASVKIGLFACMMTRQLSRLST